MMNRKIALISTAGYSFYGFRSDLIKKLILENYKVYAFTSEYTQEDLEKIKSIGAIPITYKLNRGGLNPFADLLSIYDLTKKIKEINPDIVFSYFVKPIIYGTISAKLAKVPRIIGMLEGLGYAFTEQPDGITKKAQLIKIIQIGLYKLSLPLLDKIIFLNPDDPKDLLKQYNIQVKKVEILGGIGLNLKEYPYIPTQQTEKNIRFLFIGRLLKEKGIHEYIAAANIVKQKYPQAIFTVLGAIDDANLGALTTQELENYIKTDLIEYIGHVSNVSEWIAKSHVFVLPSYREGVPRSTQEAMAIGRPIITTDVPGCRETVINGQNGFLVQRWNPQALADKMIFFIEHPEKIKIMGDISYQIAIKNFDAEKVNQRLYNILTL